MYAPVKAKQVKSDRPIFVICLRADPGIDPIRALRMALKVLKRRFGLKVTDIRQQPTPPYVATCNRLRRQH